MRIRSIRAFLLAYQHRSITRAAEMMHLTQPALTKTIHLLEQDLGVPLFDRTSRGIEPSAYGEAFAPYAERMLGEFDAAKRDLRSQFTRKERSLRVGADSYVVNEILPVAITHLLERMPDIGIEIGTDISDRLVAATAEGEFDLCITSVSRRSQLALLDTTDLFQETYAIVGRNQHPLSLRSDVTLNDVAACPWVHVGPDFNGASNIVPVFESHGVDLPKTVIEAGSLAYVVAHLRNSDSLSYQPRHLINAPDIAEIHVTDVEFAPAFRIVAGYSRKNSLSLNGRRLLTELSDFLAVTRDFGSLPAAGAPPGRMLS